ncbi:MAG TPA: MFS transporter [Dermatophilaceae bacterium]
MTAPHHLQPAPTDPTLRYRLGGRHAWLVLSAAVAVYILAVFHRTSLGVAGLIAAERFHISSAQLATFTMVQLLVYAAMQIPVGVMLDRVGAKKLLVTGVVLMTGGQFAFAFATTFGAGVAARVFVGMGDAMIFISLIQVVALWFPPARTAMVTQMTGVVGQIGAVVATAPLSAALHSVGWTRSFAGAASVGIVLGIVLIVVVRDSPYQNHHRDELKMRAVGRALKLAWAEPGTRLGLWSHFTVQFGATVFALLWGFPFLVSGQGLTPAAASGLLIVMTVTAIVTSPLVGAFVTRWPYSRSTLVLWIVVAIMAVWAVVLLWPGRAPLWLLVVLVVVLAVGGPGSMVGFDLARTFNPPTRLGSASGIVNVGGFVASLSTVALIGIVLDVVAPGGPATYTVDSFRVAMSVQYIVWVIGLIQILRFRRRARSRRPSDLPDPSAAERPGVPVA